MTADRVEELASGLADVEQRIARACAAAGRERGDVTMVAVSKTWPASDVLALASLGVVDFGESYDQEAAAKAQTLRAAAVPVRWHFVGRVQRNKCRSLARYAHVVHSLDRGPVVEALGRAAERDGRRVDALVQVSFDGDGDPDGARGGCRPEDASALADVVAGTPGLRLRGVMTVPPVGGDPRSVFDRLATLSAALRSAHPEATEVSAGMTADLEPAIAAGATLVRIGTALFGPRAPRG
ncbi:MAG TPA: YggS family pyridoxal phosphate-dependent enzyme [Mycobacteriales bacterium]|nr:YggS family pyridoxal phosphate-dependent enzyme [Mycobacteriales bacterium]